MNADDKREIDRIISEMQEDDDDLGLDLHNNINVDDILNENDDETEHFLNDLKKKHKDVVTTPPPPEKEPVKIKTPSIPTNDGNKLELKEERKSSDIYKYIKDVDDSNEFVYNQDYVDDIIKGVDDMIERESPSKSDGEKDFEEDPLERIDKEEREISKDEDDRTLESKFVLRNNIAGKSLKQFNNISYENLNFISDKLFRYFDGGSSLGIPKCVTNHEEKYIAVGTSYSYICIFDYNQKDMKTLGPAKDTGKDQNCGAVTALDISRDGDFLVSGFEKGLIVLWDINSGYILKNIVGISETAILAIKFYKETKSQIITSDNAGAVSLLNVNKVIFSFTVDKQLLLHKSAGKVCGINILKSQNNFYNSHFVRNCILAALCSMEAILIVAIEPMAKSILKIQKPESIKEGSVPYVSWGKGAIKDENLDLKNPVLAYSWGNVIQLVVVPNVDLYKTTNSPLLFQGYFVAESDIIYMSWIAANIILYVDSRKKITVLFTGDFEKGKYDEKYFEKGKNAIMNEQTLDYEITFQTFLEDSSKRPRSCYQNTIFSNENANAAVILTNKQLMMVKLYKWTNFINTYIDKGEWASTLYFCLELYKGNTKMFSDIPLQEADRKLRMKTFFNEIIKRYVENLESSFLNKYQKNETWESHILTTIDFLVFIENFLFLFTTIKAIFVRCNVNEIFLKCLEPFILTNKIKFVPNDPFREIVAYYRDLGKMKVLQHLIVNLDITSMDSGFIKTLCLEYNLYTGLVYICTRSDDDYITPLTKMAAVCYDNKRQDKMEEALKHGYKFLWFIKITLNGILFPDDQIEEERYKIVVRQIVVWMFVEDNIKSIIELDPEVAFKVFLILFQGRAADVLSQKDDDLLNYFKIQNKRRKSIDMEEGIPENIIHKCMLDVILSCCSRENNKVWPFFISFIAKIASFQDYKLDYEISIESAIFLVEKPNDFKSFQNKKIKMENAMEEPFLQEQSHLILNLIKMWEKEFLQKDVNRFFEIVELSPFTEVLCFLYNLKKEYTKCFDLYLDCKYKYLKKLIFDWLDETLKKLEKLNKDEFTHLLDYILERLKDLVMLNSDRTKEIFVKYNKNSEKKAIFLLAPWPKLQLELLSKLLEERKKGIKIDNELLILHVSLLSKEEKQKELLQEFQTYDYPLDECLKICRGNAKLREATAFLLERSGALNEALNIYLEIFKELISKAVRKIEKSKNFDNSRFQAVIKLAIDLCKKNNKAKDAESEKLWFSLLDKLLDLHKENFDKKMNNQKYERIFDAYSDVISTTFEEIIKNVSLMSLMNQISSKYGILDLRNLKKSFMSMLSNYSYEENILKSSKKLVVNDIIENGIRIFTENAKGLGLKPVCEECKNQFTENSSEKLSTYYCCHSFHRKCISDQKCLVCSRDESFQLANLILATKNKLPSLQTRKKEQNIDNDNFREEIKDQSPQMFNLEQMKADVREKMLRKLKVFDFRKEDERMNSDIFQAQYQKEKDS